MRRMVSGFRLVLLLIWAGLVSCAGARGEYRFGDVRIHSFQAGMCRVYLLECGNRGYLIDAGSPGKHNLILRKIKEVGIDSLEMIIITHGHFDHYGSAAALRDSTGATIAIHQDDHIFMAAGNTPLPETKSWGRIMKLLLPVAEMVLSPDSTTADILLQDNQSLRPFGLDATILHTPGHTPGSVSIILQDSIAFVGDLISTRQSKHIQQYYAFDWNQVKTSYNRLRRLRPSMAFPGHGTSPLTNEDIQHLKPKY